MANRVKGITVEINGDTTKYFCSVVFSWICRCRTWICCRLDL